MSPELLEARLARLAAVAEAARALLAALPRCGICGETRAVVTWRATGRPYCAACIPRGVFVGVNSLPHAASAEALERALDAAVATALAGEP